MNDTLSRIKAEAQRRQAAAARGKDSAQELAQRRQAAAAPLFKAFADVEGSFVRIDVLKEIWPDDYLRRPDRARGLVAGVLGGERYPCGLTLHIPGGQASYAVELTWDGKILYVSSRQTRTAQPQSWQFDRPEPWLDAFYHTMATLLEL
ncbi:hypothetical protein [uncultured Thiodictyon sp.]|uniref:hypothetical protein n=1 Tax=uncultured Thiodictyon sp. TaxID=1846217 RepID=UPI0025F5115D|nr:hypothetical protein [uncultured Thiodictyon sp.]